MPMPVKGRGKNIMGSHFITEEGWLQWDDTDWDERKVIILL